MGRLKALINDTASTNKESSKKALNAYIKSRENEVRERRKRQKSNHKMQMRAK